MNRNKAFRGAVFGLITMLPFVASTAAAESEPMSVAFISDAAYGKTIDRADYQRAVEKLQQAKSKGLAGFYAANNLCISYLKVGETLKAKDACNQAVARISLIMDETRNGRGGFLRNDYNRLLAMALSNRGVVNYVNDDVEMARADFESALEAKSSYKTSSANLARLNEVA